MMTTRANRKAARARPSRASRQAGRARAREVLEHELSELRHRIAMLEGAKTNRKVAERELAVRSHALAERVKELKCLYSISGLLDNRHSELGEILRQIAEVLPAAWQYPEHACARITLKSRKYESQDFREPVWRQHASIEINGERVGLLEVGYADAVSSDNTPPGFLTEEQTLLNTVAEQISDIVALKETQSQLSTYQEHLRSLASELTLTEERERHQLAVSLHDRIGQGLAVTKLKLETLKHVLPSDHQPALDDVSALVKQIIADTRSLTFEISPPILYELGLRQAVVWLGQHFQKQFGLHVDVQTSTDELHFSESVRVMLFRSVQELLTNIVKHAHAENVQILMKGYPQEVEIIVRDDGVGFDVDTQSLYPSAAGGFGLFSIRERLEHLGGRVTVDSHPGKGARVSIRAPRSRMVQNA